MVGRSIIVSNLGGIFGLQEGFEAGLATGGFASSEMNTTRAVGIGLGATAIGVVAGHMIGENILGPLDHYVGNGGIGFVPAVAIGASVTWHNLREHSPQKTAKRLMSNLPLIFGAGFPMFEGVESGILTASAKTNLLLSEVVTLGAATAAVALFGGIKLFAKKRSPKNALRYTRAAAIGPVLYLGGKAAPELYQNPKPIGVAIAAIGTVATGKAVRSFFTKEPDFVDITLKKIASRFKKS